jgi:hypothetical protein
MKRTFSFKEAVKEARRDYPQETRNISFIDMSTPAARGDFKAWLKTTNLPGGKSTSPYDETADEVFDNFLNGDGFVAYRDKSTGRAALLYNPKSQAVDHMFSKQFIFDHEFGHLLVQNGLADFVDLKDKPVLKPVDYAQILSATVKAESCADTFALLRGIRRGQIGEQEINDVSLTRGMESVLESSVTHLTMTAVDALLVDHKLADLAKLTPQQQKDFAGEHAEINAPEALSLVFCQYNFRPSSEHRRDAREQLLNLAKVVMEASSDSLEFYVAARILSTAVRTGAVDYVGPLADNLPKSALGEMKEALRERVPELGRYALLMQSFSENKAQVLAPSYEDYDFVTPQVPLTAAMQR